MNVVLWGEQATLFPGEQICKDGQAIPHIVLFVGTLVKRYAGIITFAVHLLIVNQDIPDAFFFRWSMPIWGLTM